MRNIRKLISARIRELRKSKGLTQAQLAELAELSVDEIGAIERAVSTPTLETLDKLAPALKIPLAHLLNFAEESAGPASQEIESLRLYLRTKNPEDIRFISEMMRRFLDKLEQERGR
ncbi:MAG: helix-turn-helix transcriptional regulator [Candidatus Latescibacteria bacterium]|nr:helix-turn-helix transcriptional regulator [Candidatus Latescibacterota bacterium]